MAVERVAELRAMGARRVDLRLSPAVAAGTFEAVAGAREVVADIDGWVSVVFDGPVAELLAAVPAGATLVDVTTREPDLEEVFLSYYRDDSTEG